MSTRAIIARATNETKGHFEGRYHHSDGYPTGLGATLQKLWLGHFEQDTGTMLKILLDDHPAGWSTINGADFNQEPGFINSEKLTRNKKDNNKPRCFCHGDRHEEASLLDHESECWAEWAYVFLKDRPNLVILQRNNDVWDFIKEIELEKAVDWGKIECGENLERCRHYAWFHDKTICSRCDGNKVVSAGGHRKAYGGFICDKYCVPNSKAPLPLQSQSDNDTWHVFKPKTGWKCPACGGTGKVKSHG
jgi:hypothetical protein